MSNGCRAIAHVLELSPISRCPWTSGWCRAGVTPEAAKQGRQQCHGGKPRPLHRFSPIFLAAEVDGLQVRASRADVYTQLIGSEFEPTFAVENWFLESILANDSARIYSRSA